jgi:hydrogenase small subunit
LSNLETFYDVMRRQGITRRSFMKYCTLTASALGLGPAFVPQIAHAMETRPRTPVIWLHGLECTCCSESFIRSAHPLVKDVVLSMISLDYETRADGRRRASGRARAGRKHGRAYTATTSSPSRATRP